MFVENAPNLCDFHSASQSLAFSRFLPKHMHQVSQFLNIHRRQQSTSCMFILRYKNKSSCSLSGFVFCQVCLQFQALVLIYLSLQSAGEVRLDEWLSWDIGCRSPCRWPFTANRCPGYQLCHLLRAHSSTRWQCVSVTAGHLGGRLDREGLLPATVRSDHSFHLKWSHKDFLHSHRTAKVCSTEATTIMQGKSVSAQNERRRSHHKTYCRKDGLMFCLT